MLDWLDEQRALRRWQMRRFADAWIVVPHDSDEDYEDMPALQEVD